MSLGEEMTTNEIANELAKDNLRIATDNETGWYFRIYDEENETTITVWVTEL